MPSTTVASIIIKNINNELNILLTKRNVPPFKGLWCLPGGHIDKYESAKGAVVREVKEEVGIDFDCEFFSYFDEILPKESIHSVVLVFVGYATGEINKNDAEVLETRWFSKEELKKINLAFKHNEILNHYFLYWNQR